MFALRLILHVKFSRYNNIFLNYINHVVQIDNCAENNCAVSHINVDTFACNDDRCCNADHHSDIDSLFNSGIRIFGANELVHGPDKNLVPPRGTKAHMVFVIGMCM